MCVACQLCELFLPFGKPMLVYPVFTIDIGRENPWLWSQVTRMYVGCCAWCTLGVRLYVAIVVVRALPECYAVCCAV